MRRTTEWNQSGRCSLYESSHILQMRLAASRSLRTRRLCKSQWKLHVAARDDGPARYEIQLMRLHHAFAVHRCQWHTARTASVGYSHSIISSKGNELFSVVVLFAASHSDLDIKYAAVPTDEKSSTNNRLHNACHNKVIFWYFKKLHILWLLGRPVIFLENTHVFRQTKKSSYFSKEIPSEVKQFHPTFSRWFLTTFKENVNSMKIRFFTRLTF